MNIEERLEALQKELDAWKRFARWMLVPVVLVVAGAVAWGGFMEPVQAQRGNVVRAKEFVVVDEQGKMRAGLGISSDGKPKLHFYDSEGKTRIGLGVSRSGAPALAMIDAQERVRFGFLVQPGGIPALTMADSQGRTRVGLVLHSNGSPGLVMTDYQEKQRIGLGVDRGTPLMQFNDAQGKTIWSAP